MSRCIWSEPTYSFDETRRTIIVIEQCVTSLYMIGASGADDDFLTGVFDVVVVEYANNWNPQDRLGPVIACTVRSRPTSALISRTRACTYNGRYFCQKFPVFEKSNPASRVRLIIQSRTRR